MKSAPALFRRRLSYAIRNTAEQLVKRAGSTPGGSFDECILQSYNALAPAPVPPAAVRIVPLPSDLGSEHRVEDSVTVLIDVQRMTTTLTTALAHGAACAKVFEHVEQVHECANEIAGTLPGGRQSMLLGGERHGEKIQGFDSDNSPHAYGPESVAGKMLVFTTSNGAKALQPVKDAQCLMLGSFVNLTSVCNFVRSFINDNPSMPVNLVCSGTWGERSDEDELFAAILLHFLRKGVPNSTPCVDAVSEEILNHVIGLLDQDGNQLEDAMRR
jgi:phosphosulfolactate phosphohydrolase-like enzyme